MSLSRWFAYALFLISSLVAMFVFKGHKAPWKLVALYWAVLAVKNYCEFLGR